MSSIVVSVERERLEEPKVPMGTLAIDQREYGSMMALGEGKVARIPDPVGDEEALIEISTLHLDRDMIGYAPPVTLKLKRGNTVELTLGQRRETLYTITAK